MSKESRLSYIEQLNALSKEAFDAEDYTMLREIRFKMEWEKEHLLPKKKDYS